MQGNRSFSVGFVGFVPKIAGKDHMTLSPNVQAPRRRPQLLVLSPNNQCDIDRVGILTRVAIGEIDEIPLWRVTTTNGPEVLPHLLVPYPPLQLLAQSLTSALLSMVAPAGKPPCTVSQFKGCDMIMHHIGTLTGCDWIGAWILYMRGINAPWPSVSLVSENSTT